MFVFVVDVFNILLQVLDDGRLTDGQGRTVDFRNTVIIMTSNLGSDLIQQAETESYEELQNLVMQAVAEHFRPEFINRIDDIVIFQALTQDEIGQILDLQLNILGSRLAQRELHLELTDAAREALLAEGFDPMFGARPLKRAVQNHVQNHLASAILAGRFMPGETILVDFAEGEFVSLKPEPAGESDPMVH